MEDRYQAKFTHITSGWDDGRHGRKYLDTETLYDIDWIDIHSYHTRIYLKGVKIENDQRWFNSVYFTFYLNGNPVAKEDEWEFFREAGANTYEWESDDDESED